MRGARERSEWWKDATGLLGLPSPPRNCASVLESRSDSNALAAPRPDGCVAAYRNLCNRTPVSHRFARSPHVSCTVKFFKLCSFYFD
eukprot:6196367-Pleurochrysis_carterae.AAC.1